MLVKFDSNLDDVPDIIARQGKNLFCTSAGSVFWVERDRLPDEHHRTLDWRRKGKVGQRQMDYRLQAQADVG